MNEAYDPEQTGKLIEQAKKEAWNEAVKAALACLDDTLLQMKTLTSLDHRCCKSAVHMAAARIRALKKE